jgi:hypothetical protein
LINDLVKPFELPGLKFSDKKEKVGNEKVGKEG